MSTDQRVEVHAVPEPGLLRPAVEAVLAGRPWPAGPEATIAAAVARVVAETTAGRPRDRAEGEVEPW